MNKNKVTMERGVRGCCVAVSSLTLIKCHVFPILLLLCTLYISNNKYYNIVRCELKECPN
jgi:hypothetical protein